MEKKRAAFFDVDGTLIHSTGYSCIDFLHERGAFSDEEYALAERSKNDYRAKRMSHAGAVDKLNEHFQRGVTVSGAQRDKLIDEFLRKKAKVYPWSKETIAAFRNDGVRTVLVSAAPAQITARVRRFLGADEAIASRPGRILHSTEKSEEIARFISENNVDPHASAGFGDTDGDMGIFEVVGHPFLVRPMNGGLFEAVEKMGGVATPTALTEARGFAPWVKYKQREFMRRYKPVYSVSIRHSGPSIHVTWQKRAKPLAKEKIGDVGAENGERFERAVAELQTAAKSNNRLRRFLEGNEVSMPKLPWIFGSTIEETYGRNHELLGWLRTAHTGTHDLVVRAEWKPKGGKRGAKRV